MIKPEKIYFDMDGVLADFDRGVAELAKFRGHHKQDESEEMDEKMWAAVRKVDHFYKKLEPIPGAKELFDAVYAKYPDCCEVLTGIPKPRRGMPTAGEDKIFWMHRLFSPEVTVNVVFKADKKNFCKGPGYILIDDYEPTIEKWNEMGGTGLLFTDAAGMAEKLRELGIL